MYRLYLHEPSLTLTFSACFLVTTSWPFPCYSVTLLLCHLVSTCYSVALLPCSPVTLSPCYPVTLLTCSLVTLLLCYLVTLLPCYFVALFPSYPVTLLRCCHFFLILVDFCVTSRNFFHTWTRLGSKVVVKWSALQIGLRSQ